ncbi:MAG: acetyl-CoA C-acyltransferase [Gammaproteobacteria bacterium]|nr:acetyl-CoA C-acyltransferase [Gammaproteobacteria bacterium]MBK80272.1 acetyl-CoA C-acyltransferase [Gammaproteobacteria bacterium]
MTSHAYILSAARTPIGSFQGALAPLTAPALGAHAVRAALADGQVDVDRVSEVILGNVVSAGLKQAPARQAMRQAGLPDGCGATTVNKVCGSGMKATMLANDLIRAGSAALVVAGGMESMSNTPYLIGKARGGLRMGHAELKDAMFLDGLEDAETGAAMGTFAQTTADAHQLTREAMDSYAIRSVERARAATASGALASEIAPIEVGGVTVSDDEPPQRAKVERIPTLRPAFKADGTITAANSSGISDGASALVIAGEDALDGRTPLARIAGHATHSQHPSEFTLAPVGAIGKLLERLGWTADEVDLFEINEAFAMVTMLAIDGLHLDPERVNVYGGACAQGHPIGSTGSRLIVTLAHAMAARDARRGIAALCIGGGEATAIALTRD